MTDKLGDIDGLADFGEGVVLVATALDTAVGEFPNSEELVRLCTEFRQCITTTRESIPEIEQQLERAPERLRAQFREQRVGVLLGGIEIIEAGMERVLQQLRLVV